MIRGLTPEVLIQADASDPSAASNALAAINELATSALRDDLVGPLATRANKPPFTAVIQRRYNPEGITAFNIVPGLIATILTMTMVMVTAVAMTRERERGTFENLLAMPAHRFEVMLERSSRYILVGYVQLTAHPLGRTIHLSRADDRFADTAVAVAGLFIAANLALGSPFPTIATTQLQAMQTRGILFACLRFCFPDLRSVPRHAPIGRNGSASCFRRPIPAHRPRHPSEGERAGSRFGRASGRLSFFLSPWAQIALLRYRPNARLSLGIRLFFSRDGVRHLWPCEARRPSVISAAIRERETIPKDGAF
jgi:hypothetical protein